MIQDLFTNKWILGAVGFLILFAGACYLWYQHDTAPYRQEAAETAELIQERESTVNTQRKTNETANVPSSGKTVPSASESIPDAEMKTVVSDDTPVSPKGDTPITVAAGQVRVSPHGFGPYPKIPDGWPQGFFDRELTREHELLGRVRIKLHEQGVPTLGVGIDKTGLVYPFDKDQVYITFSETYLPNLGNVRYIADIFGDATVSQQIESNAKARTRNSGLPIPLQIPIEADIPAGVQVLDKSEGFDPYEFLSLKRQ
ncbi:hypothetical protein C6496_13520 [Candidatus Poribacteria bacterium]|nr:MAG: hypothetical protein C6496_13520 [Candidatus Poribacteria bacterium]